MPRNPELDKLLREVDSLTSSVPSTQNQSETEESEVSPKARKGSSFLDAVGGFFISRVDEEEAVASADMPPPTPNTVAEVAEEIPAPEFSTSGSDDFSTRPFADIYREAGVDDTVFTVDKLYSLLQDPSLKDQPLSTKTLVLKMALKAQNIEPTVPVTDAATRDRALDAYQKMLNSLATQAETENSQKIQQINDEVRKYLEAKNAEMDSLRTQTAEARRQAETFATRRQAEEQRLAEIIMALLEGQPNPVSVGNKID